MMNAPKLVKLAIKKYGMPNKDTKILVGFSGGSDSVCLLSILYELGYDVTACHLNHNMRDTAMRDMLFCEDFCKEREIPFISRIADKGSIRNEADARRVRYRFFDEVLQSAGIEVVATAHNKDDSAETVLLNLLRGAALDGLCGISPTDGRVIRPLILVSKPQVLEYVESKNLKYMTDETNLTDIYTRNKLRNRIIPLLREEFNPNLTENIAENAELISYDRAYLRDKAKRAFAETEEKDGISVEKLLKLPKAISARVVQILWQRIKQTEQNLPHKYIEEIIKLAEKGQNGSRIDLPNGFSAVIEYGVMTVGKQLNSSEFYREIKIGEFAYIDETGIKVGIFETGNGLQISLDGKEKLAVRSRKQGDRFVPSGMSGTKSVSDYFTDRKVLRQVRDITPILTADNNIAAVGSMRAAESFSKDKRKNNYYFIVEKI